MLQWDSDNRVAITETWWDDCHDWSAAMDGCMLLKADRYGTSHILCHIPGDPQHLLLQA